MHNDRIIQLGEDLRSHVFNNLDQEPEMTGMDSGIVAKATEDAFVETLQRLMEEKSRDRAPKGWESI